MNIDLAPEIEKAFSEKLARGIDPNRIISAGIRNVEATEERLAKELQKGLDSLDRGDFIAISSREELEAHIEGIGVKVKKRTA